MKRRLGLQGYSFLVHPAPNLDLQKRDHAGVALTLPAKLRAITMAKFPGITLLGLTGEIATGKSTVANLLVQRGAAHLDADEIVRELYRDPLFARQVAALFSTPVLSEDGKIDHQKLGRLVFGDEAALARLENLVHPAVTRDRDRWLKFAAPPRGNDRLPRVVVYEAVKLLESGQGQDCDVVWWVRATAEVQAVRLQQERGLSAEAAALRLHSQPPPKSRLARLRNIPHRIIWNNGTLQELEARIELEWQGLHATAN